MDEVIIKEKVKHVLNLIMTLNEALRIGGTSRINELFIKFIDSLDIFVQISDQITQKKLIPFINNMMEAQARHDWLCLADIIQYQIKPILEEKD